MRQPHKFVFVGGLHRSGTTFVWSCLAEHPLVSAFSDTGVPYHEGQWLQSVYEPALYLGGAGVFGFEPRSRLVEDSPLVSEESRARLLADWSRHWDLDKPVLLEKSPPNLIKARFLQALFPNSYFVMITRHPVAVSYSTRRWGPRPLSILLRHWIECHSMLAEDEPYLERVRVVRYESLGDELQPILANLDDFLGIDRHATQATLLPGRNEPHFEQWQAAPEREELIALHEEEVNRFGYSLVDTNRVEPWR